VTNAEARFNNSLRPRKPEGSLGRTAQDGHLDSHTAPELSLYVRFIRPYLHIHQQQTAWQLKLQEKIPLVSLQPVPSSSQPPLTSSTFGQVEQIKAVCCQDRQL